MPRSRPASRTSASMRSKGFNSPMFLRTVKLKDFPWNGWLQLGLEPRRERRLEPRRRLHRPVRPPHVVRRRRPGGDTLALRAGLDAQPLLRCRGLATVMLLARKKYECGSATPGVLNRSPFQATGILPARYRVSVPRCCHAGADDRRQHSLQRRRREVAFDLSIAKGRVAANMRLIRVRQGDTVKLRWTTDRPIIVHLHGYDIEDQGRARCGHGNGFRGARHGAVPDRGARPNPKGGHSHGESPLVRIEVYPR